MIIFYNKKIQIKDDNWNTEKGRCMKYYSKTSSEYS
jgi:hypothetical protein